MNDLLQHFPQFFMAHWALWLAFIVLLGLVVRSELSAQVRGIKLLSPQQAVYLINREDAVVIDLRDESSYVTGHITGAIHLPQNEFQDKQKKIEKYKKKPVILSCGNSQNSTKFGSELRKNGFEQVYALKGGLNAWLAANMPLVKGA
ncbi:MAG: rhodanese-like domain-containing protein [Proteobacteria bacterium]|nr:rhodanese-like domain-containing protein [Pseudomonadota bacterium]